MSICALVVCIVLLCVSFSCRVLRHAWYCPHDRVCVAAPVVRLCCLFACVSCCASLLGVCLVSPCGISVFRPLGRMVYYGSVVLCLLCWVPLFAFVPVASSLIWLSCLFFLVLCRVADLGICIRCVLSVWLLLVCSSCSFVSFRVGVLNFVLLLVCNVLFAVAVFCLGVLCCGLGVILSLAGLLRVCRAFVRIPLCVCCCCYVAMLRLVWFPYCFLFASFRAVCALCCAWLRSGCVNVVLICNRFVALSLT